MPTTVYRLWGIKSDLKIYLKGSRYVRGDTGMNHDHNTAGT